MEGAAFGPNLAVDIEGAAFGWPNLAWRDEGLRG